MCTDHHSPRKGGSPGNGKLWRETLGPSEANL
jgi:hypothetical protein